MFDKLKSVFTSKEKVMPTEEITAEIDAQVREQLPANVEGTPAFNSTNEEELDTDLDYLFNAPEVCGWLSTEEQEQLFSALLLFYEPEQSILDVGCGRCDLYDFIKDSLEVESVNYKGIDFNPNSINIARQKYPDVNAEAVDLFNSGIETFDWVVASGAFNLRDYENMEEYVKTAVDRMYQKATIGVAFNLLTGLPEDMADEDKVALMEYNTGDWTNYLIQQYGKVITRADYFDGDSTFFIFK